jgi:hypothetical protein
MMQLADAARTDLALAKRNRWANGASTAWALAIRAEVQHASNMMSIPGDFGLPLALDISRIEFVPESVCEA